MATTAMVGARSPATTVTAGVPRAAVVTQARSCSSIDSAAGLPGLHLPAKSQRYQSCQLRSEFLPSFKVSTPVLRRSSDKSGAGKGGALTSTSFASDPGQLKQAKEDIKNILHEKKAYGIFIRLGWHDSGSFDKNISAFPKRGGANGSIRFSKELGHGANAGLVNAVNLLAPVKEKYPDITHADLYQLASATAIEDAGGPKLPMRYGRVDTVSQEDCAVEGNLPDGEPENPPDHLRKIFYRMDFSDQEIVALSGAHTIGRSRPDRSGIGKAETKYTNPKDKNIGAPGGQSWTVEWLKFDNSYFKDIKAQSDEDLLVMPTDKILTEDPGFKPHTDRYAEDQEAFFKEYAAAHAKLSELGSKWDPPEGFTLDEETAKAPKAEKFVAANYSSGETKG